MRRYSTGRRHTRPVAVEVPVGPPPGGDPDDLTTWTSSAFIETMVLPGTVNDRFELIVDVTSIIDPAAKADVGALRFMRSDGVHLGHYRGPNNRILIVGRFIGGSKNRINYYWGKEGATQPGTGFPTHAEMMAPYLEATIFDGNGVIDFSNDPATFTKVGTPTFPVGLLGNVMQCAEGSYVETTSAKLRANARSKRTAFVLFHVPNSEAQGRLICWANWLTGQRSFQLWAGSTYELYISTNGSTFTPWRMEGVNRSGWNTVGASWEADNPEAYMSLNALSEIVLPSFDEIPVGPLFNSNDPYIIGGTKVPGAYNSGSIGFVVEYVDTIKSTNHFLALDTAWRLNDVFWGKADRTPDSIDVPDISGAPLSSKVSFAKKEITGISVDTPVSVSGDGNPTYSLGSSFSASGDIKAEGSTDGLAKTGDWLSTFHTSSSQNSAVVESAVTVGTVTSTRRSTTVSATPQEPPPDGGSSPVPTGTADVTVTSRSALQSAFGTIAGGKILQIDSGDYKGQGDLVLQNRDFRGGSPLVIRASTVAYRGPLPSEGGLLVNGETFYQSGSGGAEFGRIIIKNVHNVVFQGIRTYQGQVGTAGAKWYTMDVDNSTFLTFENCKFCGFRPTEVKIKQADGSIKSYFFPEDTWTPVYKEIDPWKQQGRAMQFGLQQQCSNITLRKCMIHYFGDIPFYAANVKNLLVEDCLMSDPYSDHMRNDGHCENFIGRRIYFGRTWARQGSLGGGITHNDACQNSTKTQAGWRNHNWDSCIMGPHDCIYPHVQGVFYECDNYPEFPPGNGLYVKNCLFEARAPNCIYARPGNNTHVSFTTILQTQFGGRENRRDTTFNVPNITMNAFGISFNNNTIDKSVYYGTDIPSSKITNSTQLLPSQYGSYLNDYPQYSSSLWRPVLWYSPYTGVLNINEIRRWSPKTSSPIHPNQLGRHHGCTEMLQNLGALL